MDIIVEDYGGLLLGVLISGGLLIIISAVFIQNGIFSDYILSFLVQLSG